MTKARAIAVPETRCKPCDGRLKRFDPWIAYVYLLCFIHYRYQQHFDHPDAADLCAPGLGDLLREGIGDTGCGRYSNAQRGMLVNVLVIYENPDVRESIGEMFKMFGYEVASIERYAPYAFPYQRMAIILVEQRRARDALLDLLGTGPIIIIAATVPGLVEDLIKDLDCADRRLLQTWDLPFSLADMAKLIPGRRFPGSMASFIDQCSRACYHFQRWRESNISRN